MKRPSDDLILQAYAAKRSDGTSRAAQFKAQMSGLAAICGLMGAKNVDQLYQAFCAGEAHEMRDAACELFASALLRQDKKQQRTQPVSEPSPELVSWIDAWNRTHRAA